MRCERIEIPLNGGVLQHMGVHRGREQHRRLRGDVQRRQEIVGDAIREFADDVRGGRRDEQQINR